MIVSKRATAQCRKCPTPSCEVIGCSLFSSHRQILASCRSTPNDFDVTAQIINLVREGQGKADVTRGIFNSRQLDFHVGSVSYCWGWSRSSSNARPATPNTTGSPALPGIPIRRRQANHRHYSDIVLSFQHLAGSTCPLRQEKATIVTRSTFVEENSRALRKADRTRPSGREPELMLQNANPLAMFSEDADTAADETPDFRARIATSMARQGAPPKRRCFSNWPDMFSIV